LWNEACGKIARGGLEMMQYIVTSFLIAFRVQLHWLDRSVAVMPRAPPFAGRSLMSRWA
jgi:hypothetical protein